jgi:hypothetical protein
VSAFERVPTRLDEIQHGRRSSSGHTLFSCRSYLCGIKYPAAPSVRDHPRASRKPRARTAPGRACARRYGRHLGRGSPPQQPSSRFHGFAPREPNWLVAAAQSDSDSFDVLPSIDSVPWPGRRTDGSQKRPHITDICWRLIAPYQGDPRVNRAAPKTHRPSRHRANSPQSRLSVRPCSPARAD